MSGVVIVDLGTGNIRSVSKAVSWINPQLSVSVTSDPATISSADHLILPGQGAIGTWFRQLQENSALKCAVVERLQAGPVLGICLGLQALYASSQECEGASGLNILQGDVRHFSVHELHQPGISMNGNCNTKALKIPHMGWNQVFIKNPHPLWHGIEDGERFYFVHSYYAHSENPDQIMGECEYGNRFTAAAGMHNLFATQFHPEKSQHAGLQLLKNFLNWNGSV